MGEPFDIAAAALFFLSDDARWITGQVLSVNGGQNAHLPQYSQVVGPFFTAEMDTDD
jgi:NAD(P)-dependent dehydrogenase (short-subunit alcohol dehydrogenase family)